MAKKLIVLPGDGVGPEVIREACRVLDWFNAAGLTDLEIDERLYGLRCYRETGKLIAPETFTDVLAADAVLFGATGGPGYDEMPLEVRRDGGLLRMRREMGVYANLRPICGYPPIADAVALKPEVVGKLDMIVVRELNGGIYFGKPRGIEERNGEQTGFNTLVYGESEIERIADFAFDLARARQGSMTSVDKSNVLETSVLWRRVVTKAGRERHADVALSHILVDNCAMQLVRDPGQFDVLLADNMFGDILSDIGGAISGSLGMLPSASLNGSFAVPGQALYEPVHGSAPDIAGQGIANPIGAILSVAMCFRYTLGNNGAAELLESAVMQALAAGARTPDIRGGATATVGTAGMGDAILAQLRQISGG
jgi:3-isopropylmalate dehydrogenase